jgi:hypothetical protein
MSFTTSLANPSGIPFLYLSENEKTVVYEVRASYLDELSIGVFKAKSDRKIEISSVVNFCFITNQNELKF